ncbi:MAG: M56 family metallopeptidase [Ferruginibacter sp.]
MHLLFSNLLFDQEIIRALSWTLIHSLWQGMVLAMLAGSIIFFTKTAKPALRYNLLTGALLIFIAVAAVTFCRQIIKEAPVVKVLEELPATVNVLQPVTGPLVAKGNLPLVTQAINLFNDNAGWIVLLWVAMIAFRCIQLTAGLYGVHQLKRKQIFSPGEYWVDRKNDLCRELQINRRVLLLQSGIIKMPAVIGYLKPVILFPAGMLTSLPVEEVEAILIHELAHIRRQDFLVNMLQHITEIVFFFNPAVKWVSSLIRQERENCCDDIAIDQTADKRNYINALIAFQGLDMRLVPPLANAFATEKNHLMNRVKRIIYNNNKSLNNMEKKFLAAGMIVTSIFIFAFASNNLQTRVAEKSTVSINTDNPVNENSIQNVAVADTVPARNKNEKHLLSGTINTTVDGSKYKIVTEKGKVVELYVEDKQVPAEKWSGYKSITDKILLQMKLDMEQSEKDMEQSKKDMEQSRLGMIQAEKEMALSKLEMEKSKLEMEQDMEQGKKDMDEAKKDMEESKLKMEQEKIDMELQQKKMAEDMAQAKIDMAQEQIDMQQSKKDMEQAKKDMQVAKKDMEESKKLQEKIIGDLIKEKIIKDKSELKSYKLSNDELIVNGVKQPDAIHKKFREKYVKGGNWTMAYNYNYNQNINTNVK